LCENLHTPLTMFLSLQGLRWPFTTIVQFLQHGSPSLSKPLYFFHSSNLESFSFLIGFSFLIAFFRPDLEALVGVWRKPQQ
jgi:hypothetical protein